MREHGGDVEATLALDIHEEGVRRLHKTLELVLALLQGSRRVEQIDVLGEHLEKKRKPSEEKR